MSLAAARSSGDKVLFTFMEAGGADPGSPVSAAIRAAISTPGGIAKAPSGIRAAMAGLEVEEQGWERACCGSHVTERAVAPAA